MGEAYIVDAVRTPVGRRRGGLAEIHPADLGAHPIRALVERTGVDPAAIDDVIYGCLDAIGGQAGDIARTAALVAGGRYGLQTMCEDGGQANVTIIERL